MPNYLRHSSLDDIIDTLTIAAHAEIILTLADLCDDLDRRRIARALAGPAPLLDDETAYADLVRASADLDDLAEGLLRPVS